MRGELVLISWLSLWLFTGCGKPDASKPQSTPTPPQAKSTAQSAVPANLEPSVPPPPAATASVNAAPSAPGTPAVTDSGGRVVNGLVVVKDTDGQTLEAEKVIYKAIEIYVEGRGNPYPKSLDEVMKSGVLTSLPEAPSGKKWSLQGNKVVLVAN